MPRGKIKHGMTPWGKKPPKEYTAWVNMRQRCFNSNRPDYKYYGGRGIAVCLEWQNDFSQFYRDMGPCPKGMTLERNNVNGDYSPANCRWATWTEQHQNQRPVEVCHRGHLFTPENTRISGSRRQRLCRACAKLRDAKYRPRKIA